MRFTLFVFACFSLCAAPPSITELQPRGAQRGRPFTLTVAGANLGEGPKIVSSLPATFTALGSDKPGMGDKYATYLVEPTGEWPIGVYPIRVSGANGLSNVLLFSVGAFPEMVEEESRPGSLPHQNDSIEKAQTLPSTPITINGKLMGPERDFYRLQIKAGERRVFEVDARRVGSAIDPVIEVYDAAGRRLARSEDEATTSLDARLDMTFAKEGFYYVEVYDARYSNQAQNYYRLRTGAYNYASEIYPLGGRRGETVEVNVSGTKVKTDLSRTTGRQVFVNLPESPSLPLPFAIGDTPEISEPVQGALQLPVTVNGRLAKAGEVDRYEVAVKPGDEFIFELQARELGTSKLTGLITVYAEDGKRLASAGDGPLPVDVAAVQVSSRTLGDPFLMFKAAEGVSKITVAVEDLALRGGPHYAYRLSARRTGAELRASIVTPYVNIPAGGTAIVAVDVERRGYFGPLKVSPVRLPAGVTVSGGDIAAETPDATTRSFSRRAILSLTAAAEAKFADGEIGFEAKGGDKLSAMATGMGYLIGVTGASTQGVVDRQRAMNGQWLGYELPVALTSAAPGALELTLQKAEKKEAGFEYRFRWRWTVANATQAVPPEVNVDLPNLQGTRIIEVEVDKKDKLTGTFLVTTSKNSLPGPYNIGVNGRLTVAGTPIDIYSPLLRLDVPELEPEETKTNASTAANR